MISVNNRPFDYEPGMSVKDLIKKKKYTHPMINVWVNGRFIREEAYETVRIEDGDDIKVIHPMGGG